MSVSKLRFVKNCIEYQPKDGIPLIPHKIRGLYILYAHKIEKIRGKQKTRYDVVYIGAAFGEKVGGVHGRIAAHAKTKLKRDEWTHFSIYEVWDNVREDEIREIEGLLRHLFRKDTITNRLAVARKSQRLQKATVSTVEELKDT